MRQRLVLIVLTLSTCAALLLSLDTLAALAQPPGPYRLYLPLVMRLQQPSGQVRYVAARDAYVFEGGPNVNRGSLDYLNAGYDEDPETMERTMRSLIWFELPAGNGWRISRAILRVYYAGYDDIIGAPARLITAHAAHGQWAESTVTWANKPPLGDAQGSVGILPNDDWGYREIEVTSLVQQWFAGSATNYGFYLVGPEVSGSDWSYRVFYSREVAGSSEPFPPELVVTLQ